MTVSIQGIEQLEMRFKKMRDLETAEKAMKTACMLVEGEAKEKAPKGRTGELKGSIQHKVEGSGNDLTGVVYTAEFYAPYVEYGTGLFAENGNGRQDVPWRYEDDEGDWHTTYGMEPHPFMRPALQENRQKVLGILKEGLIE